ncbi:MAG: OstA-like protein, partial [Bacteroidales bacterium]|nr:OstA-like protein [Bacteroidales bacterium]
MRNIILSLSVVLLSTQLVSQQNPGGRPDLRVQQDTIVQQQNMIPQVSNGKQNPEERLVRLIDAKSAETRYIDGKDYRVIKGPAQFLHNNALILCDSAIWDVTLNVVNATGNVKILHNQMTISSDQITYFADRSVAEVRGRLVELIDKESNKVRTHYLDYFTKDSLAMFYNGLSMLGGDSTYIESLNGFYYGKEDRFLFQSNVQLYDDSLLMKADSLEYLNRNGKVVFPGKTHAWQGGNYLTSRGGWYDRQNELYHFNRDVYIKTKDKEIWADTLDYNSKADEATLKKDVMVLDTANSVYIYGDHVTYNGNPLRITLTKNPGSAAFTFENDVADTLFFAADTIIYFTLPFYQVDSTSVKTSKERYELSKRDPVAEQYRPSASKAATSPGDLQGKMMEKILEREKRNIPRKGNKPGILPSGTLPELKDSIQSRLKDSTLNRLKDSTLNRLKDSTLNRLKDSTLMQIVPKETILKDTSLSIRDSALILKDSALILKDSALTLKDSALVSKDTTL